MKKRSRALFIFLVCLMVFGTATSAWATNIQDAKDKKEDLEKKKKKAEKLLDDLELKKANVETYIRSLDENLEELNQEIDRLNGEIDTANKDLVKTQEELEEAETTVSEQYEIMKRRIQYMYENGSSGYIELFLDSKSMSDLLNQAEYMTKIADYDNQLLERYENSKLLVQQKEQEIQVKLEDLSVLVESVKVEQETVEKLIQDKAVEVAKYNKDIEASGSEISDYESAVEAQEDIIDRLIEEEQRRQEEEERRRKEEELKQQQQQQQQQQQNNQNSQNNENSQNNQSNSEAGKALLSGGLIWPLPSSTHITSGFGYRNAPTAGASTYHRGVDIATPSGNNILAAAAGTVVEASYSYVMGNYIIVSHGSEIYTVYEHSSKLLVSAGDTVKQGDVIALVGSTGISTGPHLHFALKINGQYVNPLDYVSY